MSNSNGRDATSASLGKVLVLDDESSVRAILIRWLTGVGYECTEARDASEAWELLRQQEIHLLTVDVRMPGESGLDLVHQIKHEFPDTVILMVTGDDIAIEAVQALTRGAFGYLIKPIDRESLLFHVQMGLAQRQRQIEDREHLRQLEKWAGDRKDFANDSMQKPACLRHQTSNFRGAQWTSK